MPVGFNSPARNLFLLGSSGAQVVTNFFQQIDQSATTDNFFVPDEIRYNVVDQKYILAGSAEDANSQGYGWFEKRDEFGVGEWGNGIQSFNPADDTTLRSMELDSNNNLIVAGKTGNFPWIGRFTNAGNFDWMSSTYSADVRYLGVTSNGGNYYACGSTPGTGDAQAFVEKYDSSGNPGWGKSAIMIGRDVVLRSVAANSRGHVVSVGYLEDNIYDKGYIVKVDTNTGDVLWDRTLSPDYGGGMIRCMDCYIDVKDQIYVVARDDLSGYLLKYSPEGNMIWQTKTPYDGNTPNITMEFLQVQSDGETEQTVTLGKYYDTTNNDMYGLLSKYSKDGSLVWRRTLKSSNDNSDIFRNVSLDADPSFYYILYTDEAVSIPNGEPDQYTFGKVSSSGNGLGGFQYYDGVSTIDYDILNAPDQISRLSDGSVRNDSTDLLSYPFNANKIVFDDLATQVTNKKRQMDDAGSFEYSGSPAIRPADFQELNLLGDVYSGSGDWSDQSGKGNNAVTSFADEEPFSGAGGVFFDGTGDYLNVDLGTSGMGSGDFTIEYWAYSTGIANPPTQRGHFQISDTSGGLANTSGAGLALYANDTASEYYAYYPGGNNTTALNQEFVWQHFAYVRSSGTIKIYVDGAEVASVSNSLDYTSYRYLAIGGFYSTTYVYKGYISNFRILRGTALYTSNFTPPTTSLTDITNTVLLTCQGNTISPGTDIVVTTSNKGSGSVGSLDVITSSGNYYFDNRSASPSTASIQLDFKTVQTSVTEIKFNGGAYLNQALFDVYVNGVLVADDRNTNALWAEDTITISSTDISSIKIEGSDGYSLGALKFNGTLVSGTISEIVSNGDAAAVLNIGPTHNATGYWEFDGTDDYISGSSAILFGNTTGSIEAWFKTADTSTPGGAIYSESEPGDNAYWGHVRIHGGKPRFVLDDDLAVVEIEANVTVSDDNWHHLVVTGDGSNYAMYVDGVSYTPTYIFGSGYKWFDDTLGLTTYTIGALERASIGNYFNGEIGEVRVYQRALTGAAAFQNYNATKSKYTNTRALTSPFLGTGGRIVVDSNLLLNYDFSVASCIEKTTTVSTTTGEIIIDDATTNGAAFGDGQCVATGYGKVVVGARGETNGVYTAGGKAYIYNAKTGALEVTLSPSDISGNDWNFGNAVAICNCSGKIAVTSNSALYLYDADGTNEIIIDSNSTLPISPPGGNTFGNGLAISGNRVWVSDDNVPQGPNLSGTVYCFNAETGAFLYELRPNNNLDNFIRYGVRIAAGGGKLAIGAESIAHPVTGRSSTGRVYLYDENGRNEKILEPDALTTSSLFGTGGLAIGYGMLVVGASRQQRTEDPQKLGNGEVYVFDLAGDLKFSIRPSDDPADEDANASGFGDSVAISSDRIIVGARYYTGNPGGVAGRAYMFEHGGKELQAWFGSGSGDASDFGSSMDAVGGTLVIGAGSGSPDASGRAYIYPVTGTVSGTIKNLSSGSYNGIVNGPTFNPTGYFEFDNSNVEIDIGNDILDTESAGTVEAWINTAQFGRRAIFSSASTTDINRWFRFAVRDAGSGNGNLAIGGQFDGSAAGTNVEVQGSLTLSPNTWHHVVGTASGTEWKLYVDGVEDTTLTVLAGSNAGYFLDYPGASTETNEYNIGLLPRANGETDAYEGNIGAFRIYNRVLTATEVSKNFNATRGKYGV